MYYYCLLLVSLSLNNRLIEHDYGDFRQMLVVQGGFFQPLSVKVASYTRRFIHHYVLMCLPRSFIIY